jgi:hypothetical protein
MLLMVTATGLTSCCKGISPSKNAATPGDVAIREAVRNIEGLDSYTTGEPISGRCAVCDAIRPLLSLGPSATPLFEQLSRSKKHIARLIAVNGFRLLPSETGKRALRELVGDETAMDARHFDVIRTIKVSDAARDALGVAPSPQWRSERDVIGLPERHRFLVVIAPNKAVIIQADSREAILPEIERHLTPRDSEPMVVAMGPEWDDANLVPDFVAIEEHLYAPVAEQPPLAR